MNEQYLIDGHKSIQQPVKNVIEKLNWVHVPAMGQTQPKFGSKAFAKLEKKILDSTRNHSLFRYYTVLQPSIFHFANMVTGLRIQFATSILF